jgi:hypothetical protein
VTVAAAVVVVVDGVRSGMLQVCPAWNELWGWIRSTLRRARINAHNDMDDGDTTHHRGDFLLFGHGFTCTTPVEHEIQGAVWEAALRTTNGLLTGLRVDATDFDTTDACTRATTVLRRLVQVDYHAATTRSGHPDRPQSVRAFATKWRGLVLTKRRTMDCLF